MGRFAERLAGLYGHKKRAEKENRDTAYEDFLRDAQIEDINYKRNVLRPINEESLKNQSLAAEEALDYSRKSNPLSLESKQQDIDIKNMSIAELRREQERLREQREYIISKGFDPNDEALDNIRLKSLKVRGEIRDKESEARVTEDSDNLDAVTKATLNRPLAIQEQDAATLASTKSTTALKDAQTADFNTRAEKADVLKSDAVSIALDKAAEKDRTNADKILDQLLTMPAVKSETIEKSISLSWSDEQKNRAAALAAILLTKYEIANAEMKIILDAMAKKVNPAYSGFEELVSVYRNLTEDSGGVSDSSLTADDVSAFTRRMRE